MTLFNHSLPKAVSLHMNNTTKQNDCQAIIFKKLLTKRNYNKPIIEHLRKVGETKQADCIEQCSTFIGITTIENVAHITKGSFCRQRLCNICAWRRQSKFITETKPVIDKLVERGYTFVFVTLTCRNVQSAQLSAQLDELNSAYRKFINRKHIALGFCGSIRSIEVTYNANTDTYHPHIHCLMAVKKNYFTSPSYLTHEIVRGTWRECLGVDYEPIVHIEKIYGAVKDSTLETIKYALKPTAYMAALETYRTALKGKRLISYSGIFAEVRKELRYTDNDILTDTITSDKPIYYNLYKLDCSGGYYNFIDTFTLHK